MKSEQNAKNRTLLTVFHKEACHSFSFSLSYDRYEAEVKKAFCVNRCLNSLLSSIGAEHVVERLRDDLSLKYW